MPRVGCSMRSRCCNGCAVVGGVAQLLDEPRYPGSMVLADAGGTSLAGLSKPLPVEDLIALALELARAVAGMHGRGVIHRDICPANIVIG